MDAWLFQDPKQKQKLGDKCPWSVGWYDPDGKRKGKKIGAKSLAEKFARRMEGQLAAGTYDISRRKKWSEFRIEYMERGMAGTAPASQEAAKYALDHFEEIIKPAFVTTINSRTIAEYVAVRQEQTSRENGPKISPATINKELRTIRAAVRKANKWGYLSKVPEFCLLKVPGKIPTYVTPEHFAKLYDEAKAARWPDDGHYTPAEWWQGLLVMAYMTGWRIGSLLSLRWQDVDLDKGFALSRAADNKGKRDQKIPLHPLVVEHLRKLVCFSSTVFTWEHGPRQLYDDLRAIQIAAGVRPEGTKARYSFHDFRRAFATMNADRLSGDALQSLMQHKAYETTQGYINMARQLNPAVQSLYVPELKVTAAG